MEVPPGEIKVGMQCMVINQKGWFFTNQGHFPCTVVKISEGEIFYDRKISPRRKVGCSVPPRLFYKVIFILI